MKEHPIIYSGEMVRAILEDRKTQTRRILKAQPRQNGAIWEWGKCRWVDGVPIEPFELPVDYCPYGKPGDRLWVRESFREFDMSGDKMILHCEPWEFGHEYKADGPVDLPMWRYSPWKSPIHMPRKVSRLMLEIINIRLERLQDISESDAEAEGIHVGARATAPDAYRNTCVTCGQQRSRHVGTVRACFGRNGTVFNTSTYRGGFAWKWDMINGKRASWESNPWVWVIEFKRVTEAADAKKEAA